jgi:hypothetical protein
VGHTAKGKRGWWWWWCVCVVEGGEEEEGKGRGVERTH